MTQSQPVTFSTAVPVLLVNGPGHGQIVHDHPNNHVVAWWPVETLLLAPGGSTSMGDASQGYAYRVSVFNFRGKAYRIGVFGGQVKDLHQLTNLIISTRHTPIE